MAQIFFFELLIQSSTTIFELYNKLLSMSFPKRRSYKRLSTAFSSVPISMFS